jgi:hypothetical protein
MFFPLVNFIIFQQKNWETSGKFCLFQINSYNFANFLLNFVKFSISKKWEKNHATNQHKLWITDD